MRKRGLSEKRSSARVSSPMMRKDALKPTIKVGMKASLRKRAYDIQVGVSEG